MPGPRYSDIREAVEAVNYNNDGVLFHQTVDRLAQMLGFDKQREWYEAQAASPKITAFLFSNRTFEFKTFADLEACIRYGVLFSCFEHNNQYAKGKETFRSSTLYMDHMSLAINQFKFCTVTSNSTLGLDYDVLSHADFNLRYPEIDSRTDVMIALDHKCLIKSENNYLMSPKYLLRLAEQKGIFR